MKIIKRKNKVIVIDINSIFYFIVFIIFLGFIIFFISLSIKGTNINMQLTKVYSQDQVNAINAIAESTIGKINNTIAVTAIFFTVIVASISVFQILKFKDFEKMKQTLIVDTTELNKDIITLKEELHSLQCSKEELYKNNIELELNFYIFKLNTWRTNLQFKTVDFITLANKVLYLNEKYPNLISNEELANIYYYKYEFLPNDIQQIREENIIGIKKSIELVKEKNIFVTRKYTRALMSLYNVNNPNKNVEEFKEIIELIDNDIEDSLWLIASRSIYMDNLCNVENVINDIEDMDDILEEVKILKICYGEYAIEKIRTDYGNGKFEGLCKNKEFKKKFLQEIY